MSGQMQRFVEGPEIELMTVIVSFQNELHQKFLEIDTAPSIISSMQAASSQTALLPARSQCKEEHGELHHRKPIRHGGAVWTRNTGYET